MRPIPGFPHYFADEAGVIWSDRSGLLLAVSPHISSGYLSVTLRRPDGSRVAWLAVHQLVLLAFLGERAEDAPCFHGKMGIRDNSTSNLRVCKSPRSLPVATIAAVLDAIAAGRTLPDTAWTAGVSIRSVSRIRQRFSNAQNRSGSTILDQADTQAV